MMTKSMTSGRLTLRTAIFWTALFPVLYIFSTPCQAQTTDLVIAPVDPASHVLLGGQHAPWATEQNRRGLIPGDTVLEHLTLVLKRSPQKQKAFERFLQELQDPSSPDRKSV